MACYGDETYTDVGTALMNDSSLGVPDTAFVGPPAPTASQAFVGPVKHADDGSSATPLSHTMLYAGLGVIAIAATVYFGMKKK